MEGNSYSILKGAGKEPFNATPKMLLGTRVHNYLLEPHLYDHGDVDLVGPLAIAVKKILGPLWKYTTPELAIQADLEYGGFLLPYKGRIDMYANVNGMVLDGNGIIVDLKVSEIPLRKSINHFGYDYQLSGYATAFGARAAIIIRVNPKRKNDPPEIANIPLALDWWKYQILQNGKPIL